MVVTMTMIKDAPMYEIDTMKRIIKLCINTSHVMFHYYQLYNKMYNNINTLENNIF